MTTRAGAMRHIIDLQQPTVTTDAMGGQVLHYTTVAAQMPAKVVEKSAAELYGAQQVNVRRVFEISLRYFPGLTETWRIVYEGLNLDVQGVINPDQKRIYMLATCWWRGDGSV